MIKKEEFAKQTMLNMGYEGSFETFMKDPYWSSTIDERYKGLETNKANEKVQEEKETENKAMNAFENAMKY